MVIVGSGVKHGAHRRKVDALSWNGLIRNGFAYGVKKGVITDRQLNSWTAQLSSSDMDELLSAADFIGRKLGAPNGELYARWLRGVLESVWPTNRNMEKAVRAIHGAGIPLCTLNYDQLLERVTGLSTINMSEINKATEWMRVKFPTKARASSISTAHGKRPRRASSGSAITKPRLPTTFAISFNVVLPRSAGCFLSAAAAPSRIRTSPPSLNG